MTAPSKAAPYWLASPAVLVLLALTGLVMALIFGSIWRLGSVSALAPGGATVAVATGPTWEGWLKPPAYTGKPTLYLNDQTADDLTVPAGTKLQLRLYGEPGSLILSETVSGRTEVPPASDPVQDFTLVQSGKLGIEGSGGRDWSVTITPDRAPIIAADGPIARDKGGRFKQKVKGSDDYGITKATVTIALDLAQVDRRFGLTIAPEDVAPVTLDLPMPPSANRMWRSLGRGKVTRSHVLDAMGVGEGAMRAIRISGGWATTQEDVRRAAEVWETLASRHG